MVIRLNPDPVIRRQPIDDDNFCVIVDDFLVDPQELIDFACANADRFYVPENTYPGLNLLLDEGALAEFYRFIRLRMSKVFSFFRSSIDTATGLSMVTFRPEELSNYQRLCHTDLRDTRGRRKYAALVYLYSNEKLGGTAFYRWKKPGIVQQALDLELNDPAAAGEFLAQHSAAFRRPPCYMTESTELAELLQVIPPRFNRLVFYSGEIPHSTFITSPELLSTALRRGRLTLNCFLSVKPTEPGSCRNC